MPKRLTRAELPVEQTWNWRTYSRLWRPGKQNWPPISLWGGPITILSDIATDQAGVVGLIGRFEARTLSLGERLAVKAVRAPEGDFREWAAVRSWAREIAAALGVP